MNKAVSTYRENSKKAFSEADGEVDHHVGKMRLLAQVTADTAVVMKAARFGINNFDSAGIDSLINKVRALRVALSPTVGTAFGIGAGIAIEQTAKAIAAQARLIDQQSLIAAKARL